ncbi:hypothetical protein ABPG75_003933 [Micractinium tetrahymenae]
MGVRVGAAAVGARRAAVTTLLMNLASIVERADEGILPAVYMFIGRSLDASLSQLGTLTLCRALVQALSSPFSGILGDRYDRSYVVAAGCLIWGVMTASIGLSRSLGQAMVSCAVNGFGLALVIPCVSSMIADYHPPETRGNAFGMMSLTASLGGMAGSFFATNIGGMRPMGIEGWRFAFHLVAAISVLTAALVYKHAVDPRHLNHHPSVHSGQHAAVTAPAGSDVEAPQARTSGKPAHASRDQVWQDVKSVLRIRSFQLIVLQASTTGIVGSIPWVAMTWFTAWLQLLGFSDLQAAGLMATFSFGCALGGLLGGTLGDRLVRRLPSSPNGRILTNQLSVLLGLPLSFLLLKGLPMAASMDAYRALYGAVLFVFGLSISWCGCNNSALMAELVPEQQRSSIFAFDRSFEGAIGAMGAPLVGLTAERLFGFHGALATSGGSGPVRENVTALSSALLVCMVVPWIFCLLSFTALHWTHARDRKRALQRGGEGAQEVKVEAVQLLEAAPIRKRVETASSRSLTAL